MPQSGIEPRKAAERKQQSCFPCGYYTISETAKAVSTPLLRRNPAAAGWIWCNKRSARRLPRRPAIGGLNWAAAQFAVVIIPYRETAKAVFPPRRRRDPAEAGGYGLSSAGRGVCRASPAKGGANWAKAQLSAVIVPRFRPKAKAGRYFCAAVSPVRRESRGFVRAAPARGRRTRGFGAGGRGFPR